MTTSRCTRPPPTALLILALAACLGGAAIVHLGRLVRPASSGASDRTAVVAIGTSWPDMRIDVNRAPAAELALLPGIGPALSERIAADRLRRGSFRSIDDLARVSGIGRRIVDRIRPYVVAGSVEAPPPPR